MAKFCKQCGAELGEGSNFCKSCGTAVAAQDERNHAAQQPQQNTTQKAQGTTQTAQKAVSAVSQLIGGGNFYASASAGVMTFGGDSPISTLGSALGSAGGAAGGALQALSPAKVLISGATGVVKGIGAAFKDKKKLLPAVILAATWIVLTLLPALGINPIPMQWLSWLTFAQGGMRGGIGGAALGTVTGFLGGVLGKGIFAGLITAFITAIIHKRSPLKSISDGFRHLLPAFNFKDKSNIGFVLTGAGLAFIGYNFMAGTASLTGTMAGIAAFLMTLKALGGKAGFLRDLLGGFLAKNKKEDTGAVNAVIAGMASGFALSVPLSLTPWVFAPYAAGAASLITGIVLSIVLNNNKEVAAQ